MLPHLLFGRLHNRGSSTKTVYEVQTMQPTQIGTESLAVWRSPICSSAIKDVGHFMMQPLAVPQRVVEYNLLVVENGDDPMAST